MNKQRGNLLLTITIIIACIAIIGGIGYLLYTVLFLDDQTTGAQNLENNGFNQNTLVQNEETSNQNSYTNITPILNEENPALNVIIIDDGNQGNEEQLLSKTYYYNQLNDYAKTIYEGFKEHKEDLKSGIYQIDFGTKFNTLLHTDNGETELNEAFQSAWNAFSYDESDLFYIDPSKMTLISESTNIGGIVSYRVLIGPGDHENYLLETFETKEQVEQAQSYIQNIVDQIVEQTRQNSDVEKAIRIHNWLISTISYDEQEQNANRYSVYGAIYDHKAVCEGYARSFKYLLEEAGVSCVLVSGTATNSEGTTEEHAWNYVQIDNKWYAVDITWDDPVIIGEGTLPEDMRYRYFLKGSESFFMDHTENGMVSENSMNFAFPTLNQEDYNLE